MSEQNENKLQQAEQFLREGRRQEARTVLVEYVRVHASSARAWWLLSFAVTSLSQQIECVERVLRIAPNYEPGHARLAKLRGRVSASSVSVNAPRPAPRRKKSGRFLQYSVLAVMACMALGISGTAGVMLVRGFSGTQMQPAPLSEQVVLPPELTPVDVQFSMPTATATETPLPVPTATLMDVPTSLPTETFSAPPPLIPTETLIPFPTDTPYPTLAVFVLPTSSIPESKISPVKGFYAPDFSLPGIDNAQPVNLSNYAGRPVVIYFWTTWCQYCKREVVSIQKVHEKYGEDGLVVLAVDVGENAALARKYRDTYGLTFQIVNDDGRNASSKYQIRAYPTLFFVNKSGVITSVNVGEISYDAINKKVRALFNLK